MPTPPVLREAPDAHNLSEEQPMEITTGRPATLAPRGMVTCPHSLATQAGVDVLRAGGSAVDAAIATSAALSVIYPHMTGPGGDAFWLIYAGARQQARTFTGSVSGAIKRYRFAASCRQR
jgi:gamma-glutamyltranspeptidase